MIRWLLHVLGLDDGSGAWYLWWSGIVGDLALLGAIGAGFKIVNCHAAGCWRFGFHPVSGTPYKTCRKHHPHGGNTVEHIHAVHEASKQG